MAVCVAFVASTVFSNEAVNAFTQWNANQNADPNSRRNQRLRDVQNFANRLSQMSAYGGGQMGGGFLQQDPVMAVKVQLAQQIVSQIQWFGSFGEMALQNNRMEYAAHLLNLQQLQQAVCKLPGEEETAAKLQMVINFLQELFNQTAPQNQPIGRAVPRFA